MQGLRFRSPCDPPFLGKAHPHLSGLRRALRFERLEDRWMLTTVVWQGGDGNTNWDDPLNWIGGAVPVATQDVSISTTSPATITIQATDAESINSLTLGSKDSLSIVGGSLTTASFLSNSGSIVVAAGCTLTVGGSYTEAVGATLSLPGGGSLANPRTDLAPNSDFETDDTNNPTAPAGWPSVWGSSHISTQYAYTGTQSVEMTGGNSGLLDQFSATPGVSYTESVDAMTPASDPVTGYETAVMQLMFYDSSGKLLNPFGPPNQLTVLTNLSAPGGPLTGSVGNQGWNHFSTTAVAPAGTSFVDVMFTTQIFPDGGGGSVFWDDAQFGPSVPGASTVTAGSISNSGTITVGPSNTVATGGNFTQTSTGTLDMQLGGAPSSGAFGLVNVTGAASLAGTLKSDLVYGYTPSSTDSFVPIEFASHTGNFSTFSFPSGSNYTMASATTFTNVVVSGAPATTVVSTINANSGVGAATTNLLGINLAYWDNALTTSQTQQMVTQAGLTLYRFPGGSSADDFHFNQSTNWGDNTANTIPQFVQFITQLGATGMVTLDYGSGSPQEAAAELAYLQGSPTDTTQLGTGLEFNDSLFQWQTVNWNTVGYWASLRAASPLPVDDGLNFLRIGQAAPFTDIKYWEVGNEEYGGWEIDRHGLPGPNGISTGAQHDPATYAAFAAQFATLAAEITHTAGLPAVTIGIDSEDPTGVSDNAWTQKVLADGLALGFVPNYISDHSYMQAPGQENDSILLNGSETDPNTILDWSTRYEAYEALLEQTLASQAASVQLMATEFNSVYTAPGKQSTSLVNGLFVANSIGSMLNSGYSAGIIWTLRNSWGTDPVGNNTSPYNDSNSLYGWREGGDYGQLGTGSDAPVTGTYIAYPGFYAEQLASEIVQTGGQVVSASSNYGDLDVYAVKETNGHLDLLVVNTNPVASVTNQFNVTGFQPGALAQVSQYGEAQDTAQSLSPTGASSLANSTAALNVSGSSFSYSFPAYSMTVLDLAPISVATSGTSASYTAGASAVHVDPALKISSPSVTTLSGATVTISGGTYQAGDTLSFTSPAGSGISIASNTAGVLTLTGTTTLANYALALQSIMFSSTSTNTTARAISIVALDGTLTSNTASETVNVVAPAKVTGVFVKGSAWSSVFDSYLATQGIGNATLGYALKSGAAELTSPLPWVNINTISVQFSEPVNVAGGITVAQSSLELLGATGSGIVAPPAISSFSVSGNTATWVFSGPLTNNQYVIGLASTGSAFSTHAITDANGAGLDGEFTKNITNLPSGNGLAGGTFDFWFNVLPGDENQSGTTTSADAAAVSGELGKTTRSASGYSIFADMDGSATIASADVNDASATLGKTLNRNAPSTPADAQVGGTDFTALALAVQETGSSQPASTQPAASQGSGSQASTTSATALTSSPATDEADDNADSSNSGLGSPPASTAAAASDQATDEAVSAFDLTDLYV